MHILLQQNDMQSKQHNCGLIYIDLQDGATTVTGLLTMLFQLTILLSFGQLAQLEQGGWASC